MHSGYFSYFTLQKLRKILITHLVMQVSYNGLSRETIREVLGSWTEEEEVQPVLQPVPEPEEAKEVKPVVPPMPGIPKATEQILKRSRQKSLCSTVYQSFKFPFILLLQQKNKKVGMNVKKCVLTYFQLSKKYFYIKEH